MRVEETITVSNRLGVHARPAAALVQTVIKYQCDVFINSNGARVNAKSIMGLLTLAATYGTELVVVCEGDDADEAIKAVKELFASGFGEE